MALVSMGEEAERRITEYINLFCDVVSKQDSCTLCRLLCFSSNSQSLLSLADALNVFQKDPVGLIRQSDKKFSEILSQLFRSLQSYRLGNLVEAYLAFENFADAFVHEFRNWKSAWALEALYVVCHQIRILAEKTEKLKAAGSFLMKVFGVVAAGKGPKRVGALNVACQLFRTYFKLGTLNLCSSVIRSIETGRVFEFEAFPRRDKVTYMYYTGRLQVLNENFPAADTKLSYALQYCNPKRKRNIRMILKYLTPVKLSLGFIPNDELLQNYNLREYMTIVQALRKGDLRLFRHALQQHEDRFLRSGLYLLLEKLELHVCQRLVKKIYTIQKKHSDPGRAHQLKIEVIAKELRGIDAEMDLDDVEGIMTMLIHKNLVKGYLAHKSKVVVLSKQDPFPALHGKPVASSS